MAWYNDPLNNPHWELSSGNDVPKIKPPHPQTPEQETEWISTPGGDIQLRASINILLYLILRTDKNDTKNIKYRVHCPKCGIISTLVRKTFWGFGSRYMILIGTALLHVNKDDVDLNIKTYETHIENGKEVVSICLACDYNRSPLSPFAAEQNAIIKEQFKHLKDFFCDKCKNFDLTVHSKHTGERIPDEDAASIFEPDFGDYFHRCPECGHNQDIKL